MFNSLFNKSPANEDLTRSLTGVGTVPEAPVLDLGTPDKLNFKGTVSYEGAFVNGKLNDDNGKISWDNTTFIGKVVDNEPDEAHGVYYHK